ncbi:SDR family oxidoreductase [bacterium]|nr:SDR family oxidoreductase [bacterium]
MNRYLVTGGGGFIGSHMVRYLLKNDSEVRVLDNFLTGHRKNLDEIIDRIDLVEADLRDEEAVGEAVKGIDYIVHLGALPSVPRSVANPGLSTDINVNGTVLLLQAAHLAGVKRIVFASSSSVYGDSPEFPRREAQYPQPLSPYAVSKLSGEFYLKCFYKLHGFETVSLRFFNVFGPRQDPNSQYAAVIPRFIDAVLEGRRPIIYGDGEQTRDFTFIEDLVNGVFKACHAEGAAGEVFNVACGRRISLNNLIDYLRELTNREITPEYTDPRAGDVRDSLADVTRAKEILEYAPSVSMIDGLAKTYSWYEGEKLQAMSSNGHGSANSHQEIPAAA